MTFPFRSGDNFSPFHSDSAESLNTRAGSSGGRTPRRSRSRQSTPQPRQTTPQPRQSTPRVRQDSQGSLAGSLEEHATVFDVQNVLRKGELVEVSVKERMVNQRREDGGVWVHGGPRRGSGGEC